MDFLLDLQSTISELPPHITIKWLLLAGVSIAIIVLITVEQRRMYRYYQRLTSHASKEDSSVAEYSLKLLSISTRNKFLFSVSFLILTFSVIIYDIRQQHFNVSHEAEIAKQAAINCNNQSINSMQSSKMDEDGLDELKRKYEKIFVSLYIANKCGVAKAGDFARLQTALNLEAQKSGGDADLSTKIINTAKSTFNELYKEFNCNDSKLIDIQSEISSATESADIIISNQFNL